MKRSANDVSPLSQNGPQQRQDQVQMSATNPTAKLQDSSFLSAPRVYSVSAEGQKAMPATDAGSLAA